ncbi:MAG: hypothetical protein JXR77_10985 [Lentisphaeria bacterium]|nr:hypothetical protein [Lentisphaeria bacterium]
MAIWSRQPRTWREVGFPAVLLLFIAASPVRAHKLNLFASVEGTEIVGYAYLSGGTRVRNTPLRLLGPDGRELGNLRTDGEGAFRFTARIRCDHMLVLDMGDGHRAEWLIEAAELPPDLPPLGPVPETAAVARTTEPARAEPGPSAGAAPGGAGYGQEEDLRRMLREELGPLQHQIGRYREEVQAFQRQVRLHDVLGGVGMLLGAAGISAYVLGRRRAGRSRQGDAAKGKQREE